MEMQGVSVKESKQYRGGGPKTLCAGCRKPIRNGEPVVRCAPRRMICADCADAKRPVTCQKCHRTHSGEYSYLHGYNGTRRSVCYTCHLVEKAKEEATHE